MRAVLIVLAFLLGVALASCSAPAAPTTTARRAPMSDSGFMLVAPPRVTLP